MRDIFDLIEGIFEAVGALMKLAAWAAVIGAVIGALVLAAVIYDAIAHRCIRWEGKDAYGQDICVERK